MNMHQLVRCALGAVSLVSVALSPNMARASQFGELHITSNTKLTDDRFGDVVFDADNVTLDCGGYMVHISSSSTNNCVLPSSTSAKKCGIKALNRSGIKIFNCVIVGTFDAGMFLSNVSNAEIRNVESNGPDLGYRFESTSGLTMIWNVGHDNRIGLSVSHDVGSQFGLFSAFQPTAIGISLDNSSGTLLSGPTIYDAASTGIQLQDSTSINVAGLHAEDGDGSAFFAQNVSNLSFSGTMRGNVNGIALQHVVNSVIENSIARNDSQCDATQDSTSTGNQWTNNMLSNWCGTVPNAH